MFEEILIVLFTLLFLYISWWKLDWAITLCGVFLPAYLLRFQAWFVPMTVLEVMVLVIFVVWLVKISTQKPRAKSPEPRAKIYWPWKWLTLLFVVSGLVAALISPDTRQAFGLWKAYILEPVLFFGIRHRCIFT